MKPQGKMNLIHASILQALTATTEISYDLPAIPRYPLARNVQDRNINRMARRWAVN
jgi:hypothetical protein